MAAFHRVPDPDAGRHDPGDFALVVEIVSDDSERGDRVVKADLYAGAGIPEYWIVDRHPGDRRDAPAAPGERREEADLLHAGAANLTP